jgi:hypothetical protein
MELRCGKVGAGRTFHFPAQHFDALIMDKLEILNHALFFSFMCGMSVVVAALQKLDPIHLHQIDAPMLLGYAT